MSEHDPDLEPPPLNSAFMLLLALAAPLIQVFVFLLLASFGFRLGYATAGMATVVTYSALFALCAPRIPEPVADTLGFVRAPRIAWLAIPFLLWSLLLSSEVDNVVRQAFPLPETMREASDAMPAVAGLVFALVQLLVFPIAYELFFRGVMQPVMVRELGPRAGIALTAGLCGLAFAMGMTNPWLILPAIVNALVLGILRHASGSIYPSLVMHVFAGGASLLAYQRAFGIPGFDQTEVGHTPLGWLLAAGLFTGVGLRLCRISASLPTPEPGEEES